MKCLALVKGRPCKKTAKPLFCPAHEPGNILGYLSALLKRTWYELKTHPKLTASIGITLTYAAQWTSWWYGLWGPETFGNEWLLYALWPIPLLAYLWRQELTNRRRTTRFKFQLTSTGKNRLLEGVALASSAVAAALVWPKVVPKVILACLAIGLVVGARKLWKTLRRPKLAQDLNVWREKNQGKLWFKILSRWRAALVVTTLMADGVYMSRHRPWGIIPGFAVAFILLSLWGSWTRPFKSEDVVIATKPHPIGMILIPLTQYPLWLGLPLVLWLVVPPLAIWIWRPAVAIYQSPLYWRLTLVVTPFWLWFYIFRWPSLWYILKKNGFAQMTFSQGALSVMRAPAVAIEKIAQLTETQSPTGFQYVFDPGFVIGQDPFRGTFVPNAFVNALDQAKKEAKK